MRKDVLIVGGGPSGLLLAHHFQDHRVDYHVLERGKVAQAWRAMRPGMVLLSPAVPGTDWTSLTLKHPLWALPGVRKPFPTREDFLCYVEAFAREQVLSIDENVAATRAAVAPGGFLVSTTAGDISCRFLVLASGASTLPDYPDIPGISLNPHIVHSCDFVHCMAYAGKRVLIIGGGNSAAEIAIELAGTARVTLCTRGPLRYFSETGELENIRGSSESILKELIRFGILHSREDDPVVSIAHSRVKFLSGDEREFDWILCATGYRPGWIPVEGGEVRTDPKGFPEISNVGESTVPGLYICGSLARFNRRCAFIHGFRNYIEKVFWDIADRL
ncbi:MAG TPA: NAD(P)-binding domain-containing protein [Candidatus Limnocylindrales bacterium]|nr:NAD(P)-binding domain-containing protein [Candidatus Limnocylindrales bacterium]